MLLVGEITALACRGRLGLLLCAARLARLVNAAAGVLFIKGAPRAPRCGFSATTVDLLEGLGAPVRASPDADAAPAGARFAYFDILSDAAVREGLKEAYKWPTFPQLYVRGALVGGLDVLREMHADGELAQTLREAGVLAADAEEGHGHSHGGAPCTGAH